MISCSHKDESRKEVGVTALGVAALRSCESEKGDKALVIDPFARTLAGEKGFEFMNSLRTEGGDSDSATMIDGMAVRSCKIDKEITKYISEGIPQVCVPGAGLDCRVWRIQSYFNESNMDKLRNVDWFELDFPEMFDHKFKGLQTYKEQNVNAEVKTYCKSYNPMTVDLSLPNWKEVITSTGPTSHFADTSVLESVSNNVGHGALNVSTPIIWLLEGFTAYLTQEELDKFFESVGSLTCPGSILISTWVTEPHLRITYHRSHTPEPAKYVSKFGWEIIQNEPLADIAVKEFDRSIAGAARWQHYNILIARKV